ncbi:MAG: ATP-dependent Clp protease adaptor ClpS [Nitrospirota bacterium]|nr:ATP-dependent Clp protease adaptor ClpS [Nitrospirota bacterium]MDH5768419.1 ATP-dependent Clp protease adaptor ClpS [Nitrospirota bacterium]
MAHETEISETEETVKFIIEPWHAILLNDDWHTFNEVICQLVKATGFSADRAEKIARKVHTHGEAICYTGKREQCEHVASVLSEIKLGVRVERMS